ncbi:MAG: CDP-alcohol phosphatidyltransferase family protein [Thermoplasmata archaeon]|nr:CDP-alcohol phosphatidyltransferase family protein [Thermoplasmata archaeon]
MLSAADSFSLLNALFGITSIMAILYGNAWLSFSLILLAVLADGVDGTIARKYGSRLPVIDEFADMISFATAPCILLVHLYGVSIIPFCYLYLFAAIVHLLNYHMKRNGYFIGITTPAAAIIVSSLAILHADIIFEIIAIVSLSILMIVPLKYPRIEGIARIISPLIIIFSITLGNTHPVFNLILLLSTLVYVIAGPFYMKYHSGEMI